MGLVANDGADNTQSTGWRLKDTWKWKPNEFFNWFHLM
jgi:hypothetical protein